MRGLVFWSEVQAICSSGSPWHGFIILPGFGVSIHCGRPALQWFAHETGHYLGLGQHDAEPALLCGRRRRGRVLRGERRQGVAVRRRRAVGHAPRPVHPLARVRHQHAVDRAQRRRPPVTAHEPDVVLRRGERPHADAGRHRAPDGCARRPRRGDYPTNVAASDLPPGTLRFEAEDLSFSNTGPEPGDQDMAGFAPRSTASSREPRLTSASRRLALRPGHRGLRSPAREGFSLDPVHGGRHERRVARARVRHRRD